MITIHLCHDGSCRNRGTLRISMDQGLGRTVEMKRHRIDNDRLRRDRQILHRLIHRHHRRLIDIDSIDLFWRKTDNRDIQCALINLRCDLFAVFRCDLLRVIEPRTEPVWWENDCRDRYRSGKRSPSHFIDPDDMCESLLIEAALHVIHGLHAETLPALSLETLHIGAYKGLHALPLIRKYLLQKLFCNIIL